MVRHDGRKNRLAGTALIVSAYSCLVLSTEYKVLRQPGVSKQLVGRRSLARACPTLRLPTPDTPLPMKLYFLGANRQVTGSRNCQEVAGRRVMVDCGMFQERSFQPRNWDPLPLPPA